MTPTRFNHLRTAFAVNSGPLSDPRATGSLIKKDLLEEANMEA
jgi:hypothetical protein